MNAELTAKKIGAMIDVIVVNKDSADLMTKRGVDPLDVVLLGSYAISWLTHSDAPEVRTHADIETIQQLVREVTPGTLRYTNTNGEHVICGTVDRDLMMVVLERVVVMAMIEEIRIARESDAPAKAETDPIAAVKP